MTSWRGLNPSMVTVPLGRRRAPGSTAVLNGDKENGTIRLP